MRRRALEKAARNWWRLPERWSSPRHYYAYSRVDQILGKEASVAPMFRALVRTVPRDNPEALRFLGAAWFEDVVMKYGDRAETLLLQAGVPPQAWSEVLDGTYEQYRQCVPKLVELSRQASAPAL